MKNIRFSLATLAFAMIPFSATADTTPEPWRKCHPKQCSNHGSLPVDLGKGSCKAHPGSCK